MRRLSALGQSPKTTIPVTVRFYIAKVREDCGTTLERFGLTVGGDVDYVLGIADA